MNEQERQARIAELREYIAKNPDGDFGFLGNAYYELLKLCDTAEEKKAVWREYIAKNPTWSTGYEQLAYLCETTEKKAVLEQGKAAILEYIAKKPDDSYGYYELANVCETNEEKKAVWREYIAKNPDAWNTVDSYRELAALCETAEEKKAVWREFIAKRPAWSRGYEELANLCETAEEKKAIWRKFIANNPDDSRGYEELAEVCDTAEEKKAVWREFIANNPQGVLRYDEDGNEYYDETYGYRELANVCETDEEKKAVWRECIAKNPNAWNIENAYRELAALCETAEEKKAVWREYWRANPLYRESAGEVNGSNIFAGDEMRREQEIWLHAIDENPAEMIGYTAFAEISGGDEIGADIHCAGMSYWSDAGKEANGRLANISTSIDQKMEDYIKNAPDNIMGHVYRAYFSTIDLCFEEAAEQLKGFVERHPNDYRGHWYYGKSLDGCGNEQQAQAEYETAWRLSPEYSRKFIEREMPNKARIEQLREELNEQQVQPQREQVNIQQIMEINDLPPRKFVQQIREERIREIAKNVRGNGRSKKEKKNGIKKKMR